MKKATFLSNGIKVRICEWCKNTKELTSENFHKDKSRLDGFMYECKECSKFRVDLRKNRFNRLSEEQKNKLRIIRKKYNQTEIGRAVQMINSYRRIDKKKGFVCDLTKEFLITNIYSNPCFYCGSNGKVGCDRKNNSLGHTKDNVVSCCHACNICRMDRFTHEEMIKIGNIIKEIMRQRNELKFISNTTYVNI